MRVNLSHFRILEIIIKRLEWPHGRPIVWHVIKDLNGHMVDQ